MIYWTSVEVNSAISCACIMTLKPLIQRLFPRLFPSKGIRTQSLQWITPVAGGGTNRNNTNNDHNNRDSRQSFGAALGLHPSRRSDGSVASDRTTKRRGSGALVPQVVHSEYRYRHEGGGIGNRHTAEFGILKPGDLDFDLDLEAQQTCSVSSTAAATSSTGWGRSSNTSERDQAGDGHAELELEPLDPGSLRAPPRAHLRLSIHVTRSVSVEKYPRSPTPGSCGEQGKEEDLENKELEQGVGLGSGGDQSRLGRSEDRI